MGGVNYGSWVTLTTCAAELEAAAPPLEAAAPPPEAAGPALVTFASKLSKVLTPSFSLAKLHPLENPRF